MLSVVTTEYSILSLSFLMNTTFCKVVFFLMVTGGGFHVY